MAVPDAMERKRLLFLIVLLFSALYYVVRIAIFYAGLSGSMEFEEPQTEMVEGMVLFSFLAIGVVGLAMLPGLYLGKHWAFWGTVAVSAYTVVFDLWAFLMVQSSAGAGIIPAGVILGYLVYTRKEYLAPAS